LGGEWNCQVSNNGLPFLYQAKILHYFATSLDFLTSPFIFSSKFVLYEIKKTGKISKGIFEKLKCPKSAFELNSKIFSDKDVLEIIDSSIFSVLRRLRKKNKKVFEIFNSLVYYLLLFLKRKNEKR
jgi:hypothetical protein